MCGADGVSSCTVEVIDSNASPAVTIEQNPTLSSSPSLHTSDPVYSDPDLKSTNTRTRNHSPDITGENYGEQEEHLLDTNEGVLEHIYNSGRDTGLLNSHISFNPVGRDSVQLQGHMDQAGKQTVPEDDAASLLIFRANSCRFVILLFSPMSKHYS